MILLQAEIFDFVDTAVAVATKVSDQNNTASVTDLVLDSLTLTEKIVGSIIGLVLAILSGIGAIRLWKPKYARDKVEVTKDTKVFEAEGNNATTESKGGMLELNAKLETFISDQAADRMESRKLIAKMHEENLRLELRINDLEANQRGAMRDSLRMCYAICSNPKDCAKAIREIAAKWKIENEQENESHEE